MYQTIKDIRPGDVINIGQPFQGWSVTIVDPETLKPMPVGETGEMLFSSELLAAQYVNLPELTDEKFITYESQRTYRTGDMGKVNEDGDFFFLGRIDTQVKIHGHRVELESIESQALEIPGVRLCSVVVTKGSKITAFVVADVEVDDKAWIERLEKVLPHYCVPAAFVQLEDMPRLQSGKIDRKGLAATMAELEKKVKAPVECSETAKKKKKEKKAKPLDSETELALKMCREVLDNWELTVADDLHAAGLDSISGAKLANAFSKIGIAINLVDIYQISTVQELRPLVAEGIDNPIVLPLKDIETDHEEMKDEVAMDYCLFTTLQCLWNCLLFIQVLALASFYMTYWIDICYATTAIQCDPNAYVATAKMMGLGFGIFFLVILEAVVVKWLVMGRYTPGIYPLFGKTHLAHFITNSLTGWALKNFHNTVFECWILKLLGSEIGQRVTFREAIVVGGYDLLTIGDRAVIGHGSELSCVVFERGFMRIGPIHVAKDSIIGTQCAMEPSTSLDGRLMDLSSCVGQLKGTCDGVPAHCVGPYTADESDEEQSGQRRYILWSFAYWISSVLAMIVTIIPGIALAFSFFPQSWDIEYAFLYVIFVTFFGQAAGHVTRALLVRLIGRISSGICERFSFEHYRIELKHVLCDFKSQPFGGTLVFNVILWLHGYDISFFSDENDVPIDSIPDMFSIGHEVFTTAGHICRPSTYTSSFVITEHIHIGDKSMVGNVAVLTPGMMKDNLLLGVMTRGDIKSAFKLPGQAPSQQGDLKEIRYGRPAASVPPKPAGETLRPVAWKFVFRLLFETMLLLIPFPRVFFAFLTFRIYFYNLGMATCCDEGGMSSELFLAFVVSGFVSEIVVISFMLCCKWCLIGRVASPTTVDLWEPFARCWQMSYSCLLWYFRSCPVLPGYAAYNVLGRFAGATIGHRVVGVTAWVFVDPDMWKLGDDVLLNNIHPQAHTFEDHNLDIGTWEFGEGVSALPLAMIMQNTKVEEHSVVAALSCVMKSTELQNWGYYEGVPATRVADVDIMDSKESLSAAASKYEEGGSSCIQGGGFALQAVTSSADRRAFARSETKASFRLPTMGNLGGGGGIVPGGGGFGGTGGSLRNSAQDDNIVGGSFRGGSFRLGNTPSALITPRVTEDYDPGMHGCKTGSSGNVLVIAASEEFELDELRLWADDFEQEFIPPNMARTNSQLSPIKEAV